MNTSSCWSYWHITANRFIGAAIFHGHPYMLHLSEYSEIYHRGSYLVALLVSISLTAWFKSHRLLRFWNASRCQNTSSHLGKRISQEWFCFTALKTSWRKSYASSLSFIAWSWCSSSQGRCPYIASFKMNAMLPEITVILYLIVLEVLNNWVWFSTVSLVIPMFSFHLVLLMTVTCSAWRMTVIEHATSYMAVG